jgi:hypothetical protein
MTTYNVVSPSAMVAGQPEDVSVVLANFNAIAAILNGNLDNGNLNAAAAIVASKIAFDATATWNPAWTSGGTQPVLGNGTLAGRYVKVGFFVWARFVLVAGTTTTFGTGGWIFSLPALGTPHGTPLGLCEMQDASVPDRRVGYAKVINATATINCFTNAAPGVIVDATNPIAWANGDVLQVDIGYTIP